MTALAGYWTRGHLLAPDQCDRMLAAQSVYAPASPAIWSDRQVTLGRRLHRLLPEDAYDRGVVLDCADRALIADVRVDNREALARGLALDHGACLSDTDLLGRALERWGEDALDRIVGDFAFAWWDPGAQRLLLARDYFGQRPLHYHVGEGFVAFASMPKGLHALPNLARVPDARATAGFLALADDTGGQSFFAGIDKVPSGHVVAIDPGGVTVRRYWRPSPRTLRLPRAEDYAEALREQMDRAVAARLRGAEQEVAATLSGGLDSSTVAATAARLLAPGGGRVTALTAVPRPGFVSGPGELVDEGPLAAAVAALYPNMTHLRIATAGQSPLDGLDRNAFLYDQPILNICNGIWADALREAARARGLKVMLTGAMGNASFSHDGMDRLHAMLAGGRLLGLAREALALVRRGTAARTVAAAAIGPLLPAGVRQAIYRLTGRATRLSDYSLATAAPDPQDENRADIWAQRGDGRQRALLRSVDYGNYTKGVLGGWGIDLRDPTADRRLVEFCLSVPLDQYLTGGVRRALARRAFADRLPAAVVNETRKGYQGADWYEGLDAARPALAAELAHIARDPIATALIDLSRAQALMEAWPDEGRWREDATVLLYRHALLRGVSTGHFLRKVSGVN